MKKSSSYIQIIILSLLLFTSCHSTKYTYSGDKNAKLNFTTGTWLLNDIQSPARIKNDLTKIANGRFTSLLGNRLSNIYSIDAILPNKIPLDPSKSIISDIKNGTNYDYFINIKVESISEDFGDIIIGEVNSPVENHGKVTLEVYDLNLATTVYSQSINARIHISKDTQDVSFAKSTNNLLIKAPLIIKHFTHITTAVVMK